MAKKKRERIAAVKAFPNVSHAPAELRGTWRSIFHNDNPIILELGCGRGDVLLALAAKKPQHNYVGVDLKGARLWAAAKKALDDNLTNTFFICSNILEIGDAFEPGDVSEFWITFPDPYPKKPRKRMTAARYLDVYAQICRPGAIGRIKTDDTIFFQSSLESLQEYGCTINKVLEDIHGQEKVDEMLQILTTYERKHIAKGLTIKYIEFSLPKGELSS